MVGRLAVTAALDPSRHVVLAVLAGHIGHRAGIDAVSLAARCAMTERRLRRCISALREDGVAVCGRPETGYFIAETAEELDEAIEFLRARAMHSLQLISKLRRIPLPDLIGQLRIRS